MPNINRREFSQLALALGASARSFGGGVSIDDTLRSGIERRKIPCRYRDGRDRQQDHLPGRIRHAR